MVAARELITICRQIGTMMEVGVDFLRIIRALRDQTDNPRLLELYDQIEHDMRMGGNLADAIDKAPDVFSPFAVSLIRQGDVRGDIEGAWHRLADFYKQEAQENKDLGLDELGRSIGSRSGVGPGAASEGAASEGAGGEGVASAVSLAVERWESLTVSILGWGAALLLLWALIYGLATAELIASRWTAPLQWALSAIVAGAAALSLRRQANLRAERQQQAQRAQQRARLQQQSAPKIEPKLPDEPLVPLSGPQFASQVPPDDFGDDFEAPSFEEGEERPF